MQTGLIVTKAVPLGFVFVVVLASLAAGCASEPGIIEKGLARVCERYERGETLVQKLGRERLRVADGFPRSRASANTRVATD